MISSGAGQRPRLQTWSLVPQYHRHLTASCLPYRTASVSSRSLSCQCKPAAGRAPRHIGGCLFMLPLLAMMNAYTDGNDGPAADRAAFKPQDAATSFPLGLLCKRRCALSCITGHPGKPSSRAPIHRYARLSTNRSIFTCVCTCVGAYLANILDAGKNSSNSSGLGRCRNVFSSSAIILRVPHVLAGGLP